MQPSFTSPRQVKIGDAAAFAGTTPRAIRHYHEIGLLPEPERGADGRRRYGHDDMIRLLWIRRMADAGIRLDDMRAAFDEDQDIEQGLEGLDRALAAREAEIARQRATVQRLRAVGSPLGLLSDLVVGLLGTLPPGALRRSDLEALLVTERVLGPLGAAVQATSFVVLATHPGLRAEEERLDAAEAALDDGVDPDDPVVEEIARRRCAHLQAIDRIARATGLDEQVDALFDTYEDPDEGEEREMSAFEAFTKMPYDFSPARTRCLQRSGELLGQSLADR
ncbi:MerR family transcriptional regulator [Actinosynnema pretiosum subsp. pretiosum]|uniref:Transcriptional regulator, MerR family n=2 Tax=Actinosynnema TaxID=40566 RepID=C6WBR6_ACTMD|nr:MerR family transcriptional regulator [Actinosynnema mirum]ACU37483.1 transcriptional regulator, MerR family [Actinosynnema mirum DSM 43827]AXX30961.1 putative MerR-family transcriptional regulator [Actinosynnema pretiosum subsp. pretiosum]QUF04945.1 MerR family transcriptional regulator [Actinosynnema pretiosum subsp. pretiosum]